MYSSATSDSEDTMRYHKEQNITIMTRSQKYRLRNMQISRRAPAEIDFSPCMNEFAPTHP